MEDSPIRAHVVFRDETGAPALTRSPVTLRVVGYLMIMFGLGLVGALAAIVAHGPGPFVIAGCSALVVPATLCAMAGIWLLAVRESWHPRPGVLERRRQVFGQTWSRRFEPLGLELCADADSDGNTRWRLIATGGGDDEVLITALGEGSAPTALGEWLAARTGVSLNRESRASEVRNAG